MSLRFPRNIFTNSSLSARDCSWISPNAWPSSWAMMPNCKEKHAFPETMKNSDLVLLHFGCLKPSHKKCYYDIIMMMSLKSRNSFEQAFYPTK